LLVCSALVLYLGLMYIAVKAPIHKLDPLKKEADDEKESTNMESS